MFFQFNTALAPPYSVLVDRPSFSNSARTQSVTIGIHLAYRQSSMVGITSSLCCPTMLDCLYAKCIPIVTDCVLAELEKLGPKYRLAEYVS
jgi:U3 small nucleolar RNA-associated protein 24